MLFLNNDDVAQVLTMKACMEALEEGHREVYARDAVARPRIDVWAPCDVPDAYFQWGSMEGTSKRWRVFACRVKSDIAHFVKNSDDVWTHEYFCQEPGKFCGLILLFSLVNGEPLAVINDGILQHMRVGARAGALARHLARADARTVGMIGSGGMARVAAMAFKEVRAIERVQVYSPTPAHREGYAREMAELLDVEVVPVERPQDAVRGAEIVACGTDSIVPVLKGEWLEEGMFVTTVKPMELDDAAVARIDAAVGSPPDPARTQPREPVVGPQSHSGPFKAYIAGQPEQLARIPTAAVPRPIDRPIRWISARGLEQGTARRGGSTTARSSRRVRWEAAARAKTGRRKGRLFRPSEGSFTIWPSRRASGARSRPTGSCRISATRGVEVHRRPLDWFVQDIPD